MDQLQLVNEMRLLDAEHGRVREIAEQLPRFCLRSAEHGPCDVCGPALVGQCASTVLNTLVVLQSFSMMHFAHEEDMMRLACPERGFNQRFGAHVDDHAQLSSELMRISAQVSSMPPSSMIGELVQLVRRWLDNHLANYDEALTEYLQAACR